MLDRLDIYRRPEWQMALGERAAIEGLLAQLKPDLALEIGTAEGGSLARIAAHAGEVHAVDLSDDLLSARPANVTVHVGDSHELVPDLLERLAEEGRNVDFALIDGDHSAAGARADIAAILDSPAVRRSVVLVHDSINPEVRAGIEAVDLAAHPKVAGFDLDFVAGRVGRAGVFDGQLFGGFALIVVDEEAATGDPSGVDVGVWSLRPGPLLTHDAYAAVPYMAAARDGVSSEDPHGELPRRARLEPGAVAAARAQDELLEMKRSWSWRLTAPLRRVAAAFRRTGGERR